MKNSLCQQTIILFEEKLEITYFSSLLTCQVCVNSTNINWFSFNKLRYWFLSSRTIVWWMRGGSFYSSDFVVLCKVHDFFPKVI